VINVTKISRIFYTFIISFGILIYFIDSTYFHKYFLIIIMFNISLDILFRTLYKNALLQKKRGVFLVLLSSVLRLVLSFLFLFLFGLFSPENYLIFVLNFLIVFLLFVIFEITILLSNLQHI
ncbi:uncharacterized protein METZ01_LOCUS20736, partial [marine metagenome]